MTQAPSATKVLPGHIKSGDNVLLQLPSGERRSIRINDVAGKVNIGKFGSFLQRDLLGHPYGLSYEILHDGTLKVKAPDTIAELEDTGATNELINDAKFVQPLTSEEIDTLKKTPGVTSADIIKMQIAQNANYDMKTEYSKEKYKKRKEAKFRQGFSILEPTIFNICEFWFAKDAPRIRGIRPDTLAQMMSFANVHPGSRVLVVDDTGGLLLAAVLDRLGGDGRIFTLTDVDGPPTYSLTDHLNIDPVELSRIVSHINWLEVDEEYAPLNTFEPETFRSGSQKFRSDRRKNKAEEARQKREEFWAGEWEALLVASEFDSFEIVEKLCPYLAGSANIVIHSPYLQTLSEVHQKMRAKPEYLGPSITESWLRQYQVLPGRTHPLMNTTGSGGYLLTAVRVFDDENASSAIKKHREERTAQQPQENGSSTATTEPHAISVPTEELESQTPTANDGAMIGIE